MIPKPFAEGLYKYLPTICTSGGTHQSELETIYLASQRREGLCYLVPGRSPHDCINTRAAPFGLKAPIFFANDRFSENGDPLFNDPPELCRFPPLLRGQVAGPMSQLGHQRPRQSAGRLHPSPPDKPSPPPPVGDLHLASPTYY